MLNSLFPGMAPNLEAKWPQVHARLIGYARNQIDTQLPVDLQANIEVQVTVSIDGDAKEREFQHRQHREGCDS